jgi:hypothetical protein
MISLSLSLVLLLLPLSSSSARTVKSAAKVEPKTAKQSEDVDSFIIENVDGVSTCRAALKEEVPLTLKRPDDVGIAVESLVATPAAPATGLTINFVALTQLQSDPNMATVVAAFQKAAAVWTARIKNPVTITINIDYGFNPPGNGGSPFPTGVLGSTSSRRTVIDYQGARTNLLAGASSQAETNIYSQLPTSFVPTDRGNGGVVQANRSVAFALGLPVTTPGDQVVATMGFNKNFAFDFNPDDGISGGTDFVAVATHEIGHALGFTSNSGVDLPTNVTLWDLFRFRPGVTAGTFPTATRIMSIGGSQVYFTGETFTVAGSPTTEVALSTGGPNPDTGTGDGRQSSHWKDDNLTGQLIGIMDPTIGANVHREATENDFMALEKIGWNLIASVAPPPAPPAPSPPANDNFANAQVLSGCSGSTPGINVGATREASEPIHSPDDVSSSRSVWYQWQSPGTGSATITTLGSPFDTVLAVYSGSSLGTLVPLGKDDDGGADHTSVVTFNATAGTTYRIAVDGYNNDGSGGDIGTLTVNWGGALCTQPSIQQMSSAFIPLENIFAGSAAVPISRTGDTAGTSTVDYATSDTAGNNGCNVNTGAASSRCDYIETRGTITFGPGESFKNISIPIINDSYAEGPETFTLTLSNPTGATLGLSTSTFTIQDDDVVPGPNPIDNTSVFVRQHYIDFLNREPDTSGFNFWTNEINSCAGNPQCVEIKRINVSAAFFLSIEFQETGYLVYRVYKSAFGTLPGAPVPVVLSDFLRDTQRIGQGVQVNVGNWEQQLEANKQAFTLAFVQRADFVSQYPANMTATSFVTQLSSRAGGGVISAAEQTNLINQLTPNPSDPTLRAQVLRAVAEDNDLKLAEFNRAFVLMQYFGYMRRSPNSFPDSNFDGYNFWLAKLNLFNGNYIAAEMVKAFISSDEYRHRFGP